MAAIEVFEIDEASPEALQEKRCYSIDEIMDILGISRPTAYNLINSRQFRSVKVGGKHRISKKSFDQWLDMQE